MDVIAIAIEVSIETGSMVQKTNEIPVNNKAQS
jgi:hypothetical protein